MDITIKIRELARHYISLIRLKMLEGLWRYQPCPMAADFRSVHLSPPNSWAKLRRRRIADNELDQPTLNMCLAWSRRFGPLLVRIPGGWLCWLSRMSVSRPPRRLFSSTAVSVTRLSLSKVR